MQTNLKECQKIYREKEKDLKEINDRLATEDDANEVKKLKIQSKKLCEEIDSFVLDVYARAVFDVYSIKKPRLIRRLTKEVFTWDEAFGNDFEKIPSSLKESLVGLVEGSGRYKLK